MKGSILVVDDQASPRRLLAAELAAAGFAVREAADGEEGWSRFCEDEPDLVITDLEMPRCDGHALLCRIRERSDVPVIVVSERASLDTAARVLEAGAHDFVVSHRADPADWVSRAGHAIGRSRADGQSELEQRLAGASPAMARVRARVAGVAPLAEPVLVVGEPGTGRSTVVRAVHELGSTAGGALVRIDCATWEPTRGLPRAAAVHLDGLELLSPGAQAFWSDWIAGRLCAPSLRGPTSPTGPARRPGPRVLASAGPLLGVGSGEPSPPVDGRRPASVGPGLAPGLLASLARFPIELPPLRERREDVGPIAAVIVSRLARAMGRRVTLSPGAVELLAGRRWRGNVRQLEQLLERAVAFTTEAAIRSSLLVELIAEIENDLGAIRRRRVHHEREVLMDTLRRTGGNVSQTAALLGRSRGAVYRLMAKHGVTGSSG